MKRKLLKTFLLAAGLLVGESAWADKVLYSQDYQSATDASSWTSSDGSALSLSLQTASTNKFIRVGTSTNGHYAYTNFFENNTPASSTFYKSYTYYTMSFDAILSGSTRQPSELVVMANGHSMPGSVKKRYRMINSNNYTEETNKYLLFLQSTDVGDNGSTNEAVYQKFYINQTSTTVTLPKNAWCTYTLNVTPAKVYYTITNKSTSEILQSGSYDIPDEQSNLAQGLFTFLHKGGTSSSGSGGQGGRLDIDNINIRIEPITATLDHTAGAQWGSNTGASTVDTEKEHYNKDRADAWAGCAYAKFSFSIPTGYTIRSATLTYSVNQGGKYSRDDIIYYMAKDFDIDWANFAGQTGTDLRNTSSRGGTAVAAATTGGTGDCLNLSQDVTSSVQAIYDSGQNYIIFQWTGNDGGADLYGKGSANKPTLAIETVPEAIAAIIPAIDDCEAHETSSDFATYIDGLYEAGSLNSADDVYAAHTAWQIEQADAASSNDITKVIFDAAVSDFTRWNSARNDMNQQYTGAPDNKYFDAYNNEASDAKQKIHGLPAGTYTIKVATRASEDVTNKSNYNVWVSGGSASISVLGSHIGNSGGSLENGWNWTILSFTLDTKADVEIGFYSCPPTSLWASCDDWHLYKGMLEDNVSVTVSNAGFATFVSPYALDFTSKTIKPYTVTVDSRGVATLTEKAQIPSNTPVLLYKEGGATEDIPVIAAADALGDNDLKAGKGLAVATDDGDYKNMILNNVEDKIGFYFAAGQTVATNRAYLHIASGMAPAANSRMMFVFDSEATGVKSIENGQLTNDSYYDLQGRRVAQPTKGLYIKNGKKVIMK